jgi:periplasmic protein TonB
MSDKPPLPKTDQIGPSEDGTLSELQTLALEYKQDRKIMRIALIVAFVFHIGLFMVHFPEMVHEAHAATKKERKIFVVQQPKFKPPEQRKVEILKPRTVRVPIPDPTPDEPEPVREIQTDQEVPQVTPDDAIFGVPEAPPAPVEEGPIRVGGKIKEPKKLYEVKPVYPEIARKARIEGVVILECTIDKQGLVKNIKVLRPLPMGLTEAAVDAVKQWRYEPSTLNGRPVEVLMTVTVTFRLQ